MTELAVTTIVDSAVDVLHSTSGVVENTGWPRLDQQQFGISLDIVETGENLVSLGYRRSHIELDNIIVIFYGCGGSLTR